MGIKETEDRIVDEFSEFGDNWELRYEHLIQMGKSLSSFEEAYKTDKFIIRGCQSKVWIRSQYRNGKVIFEGDSDAILTRGLVALVIRVLTNQDAKEISMYELTFIERIGLREHLSPTRANGLLAMLKQMKMEALVWSGIN